MFPPFSVNVFGVFYLAFTFFFSVLPFIYFLLWLN